MRTLRRTVLLELAYDGAAFHGVAPQPELRTITSELRRVLEAHFGEPMRQLAFAARTDAGVCARQNYASAHFRSPPTATPQLEALRQWHIPGLEIVNAWLVQRNINARNCALAKHYRYSIVVTETAGSRCWQLSAPLDVPRMQQAAQCLVGSHDFGAFRSSGCAAKHTTKHITALNVRAEPDGLEPGRVEIDVHGDAFLRRMVRIIAGTLVEVGQGLRSADSVASALASRERKLAGITAPAVGLELIGVSLDPRQFQPTQSLAR